MSIPSTIAVGRPGWCGSRAAGGRGSGRGGVEVRCVRRRSAR